MGSCSSGGGDCSRTNGGVCYFLKLLIRALAVVGLFWILLAGSPAGGRRAAENEAGFVAGSNRKFRGTDRVVAEKVHGSKLDRIAYMSKRRVPNGPDPIHNRRAGKSGKPPGQA